MERINKLMSLTMIGFKMEKKMFVNRLKKWAEARGYRVAVASADVLGVVREKLEARRDAGMIEAGFFREKLAGFRYLDGCGIEGPKALVMVSVPSPIHVLPFMLAERRIDGLIPPTYVNYRKTFEDVLADMKANVLSGENDTTGAEILSAPLKSLAVHMGLVSYGRNNITYAPGFGSSHQLCGYVVGTRESLLSSAGGAGTGGAGRRRGMADKAGESQEENRDPGWKETVMDRCSSCRACVEVCPTGAIREDKFLISAERCFTLFSESKGPMPEWVRRPASMCLIGCLACQAICPENKGRLKYEPSGVEFTAEETEAILAIGRRMEADGNGGRSDEDECEKAKETEDGCSATGFGDRRELGDEGCDRVASASARAKFDQLGMSEDIEAIGRNLRFFLR